MPHPLSRLTRCVYATAMALVAIVSATIPMSSGFAQESIQSRHMDISRGDAAPSPRRESDQAVVDGWPLYRTLRGQTAFNDAMATLQASDGAAPSATAFRDCRDLDCRLALPRLDADGWLVPGRLWTSPSTYLLFVLSPRLDRGQSYQRRAASEMRYFVFHEFHNSSRNTDVYDTISAHRGPVFVPFYMSKAQTDAQGRRFVVVMQVAPYDVVSIHATNWGSAGPGVEIAKNAPDSLEQLQMQAGVVIASIVTTARPGLQVVHHRGTEGLAAAEAYERHEAQRRDAERTVTLPFVVAQPQRIARATAQLDQLILRPGAVARAPEPVLVGPVELATRRTARPMLVEPIRPVPRPTATTDGRGR